MHDDFVRRARALASVTVMRYAPEWAVEPIAASVAAAMPSARSADIIRIARQLARDVADLAAGCWIDSNDSAFLEAFGADMHRRTERYGLPPIITDIRRAPIDFSNPAIHSWTGTIGPLTVSCRLDLRATCMRAQALL